MENEALKLMSKANNEEDAANDYVMDDHDIYAMIARMNVLTAALAALNEELLNKQDAADTLVGCEYLSRDLVSTLKEKYEQATK